MERSPRILAIAATALFAASLAGCSHIPFIGGSSDNSGGNSSSTSSAQSSADSGIPYDPTQAAIDRISTDQQRSQPGLLGQLLGNKKKSGQTGEATSAQIASDQQRIAELEKTLQSQALNEANTRSVARSPAAMYKGLKPKIGVYVVPGDADSVLAARFESAVAGASRDYPISLVGTGAILNELDRNQCQPADPAPCADKLALFPGVRILAVVSGLKAHGSDGTGVSAQVTLIDTDFNVSYPPFEVSMPAIDGKVTAYALQGFADKILLSALDKSQVTPWFTRAFSKQGKTWYLSAGDDSGLKQGDTLAVHAPGNLVRAPSGSIAGWIPGPVVGHVKVTGFFGNNLATAVRVDGRGPSSKDYLLQASSQ